MSQTQLHPQHQTSTLHLLVPNHQSSDRQLLHSLITHALFKQSPISSPLSGLVVPSLNYLPDYPPKRHLPVRSSQLIFSLPQSSSIFSRDPVTSHLHLKQIRTVIHRHLQTNRPLTQLLTCSHRLFSAYLQISLLFGYYLYVAFFCFVTKCNVF